MRVVVIISILLILTLVTCQMSKGSSSMMKLSNGKEECSGHGHRYADNIEHCECDQCFNGTTCSQNLLNTCDIIDVGGNPLMYQEFWTNQGEQFIKRYTIEETPSYRTGYLGGSNLLSPSSQSNGALSGINKAIRTLHRHVGNLASQVIDDYYIVIGHGCTHLIAASTWALHQISGYDQVNVFAEKPYYNGYRAWADMYPSNTHWNDSLTGLDQNRLIEFVTLPNNPTGEHRYKPHYDTKFVVHDMVYYWPGLTNINKTADFDVMLFSLSKLSGHAGTRFGWAFVKDLKVAQKMSQFIQSSLNHPSVDAQFRALSIINAIIESGDALFDFVKDKMTYRWSKISKVFSAIPGNRFTVLSVPGQYYLFIRCNDALRDPNCHETFQSVAGITGWEGRDFGMKYGTHVRFELVVRDATFEEMISRFERFL